MPWINYGRIAGFNVDSGRSIVVVTDEMTQVKLDNGVIWIAGVNTPSITSAIDELTKGASIKLYHAEGNHGNLQVSLPLASNLQQSRLLMGVDPAGSGNGPVEYRLSWTLVAHEQKWWLVSRR